MVPQACILKSEQTPRAYEIGRYCYHELYGATGPAPGLLSPIEYANMIDIDWLHMRSALNRWRKHPYSSQSIRLVDETIRRYLNDELYGATGPASGLLPPIEHADMIDVDQLHMRRALN